MKDYKIKGNFETHIQAESMVEAIKKFYKETSILQYIGITYVKEYEDGIYNKDSIRLYHKIFDTCKKNIEQIIKPTKDGLVAKYDSLDLSFLDKMRDTTIEEQKDINDYINSISQNTGINFFDYLKKE